MSAEDIGRIEQELVREGLPHHELRRLCDVHLAVMGDALESQKTDVPPGHPLHTFKEEHKRILDFLDKLEKTVSEIKEAPSREAIDQRLPLLRSVSEHLMEIEKHNEREENVLFPYLEKQGITEPPAVMWSEHNDLRDMKKELHNLIDRAGEMSPQDFARQVSETSANLVRTLSSHIFKENNVLYPMALQTIPETEWPDIRQQCDELGYCCFTPESAKEAAGPAVSEPTPAKPTMSQTEESPAAGADRAAPPLVAGDPGATITFPTGALTHKQLEWMLNTLPLEITFVDKDDVFRYFSGTKDRAFARARASIGRKVQQCHPQKSLDKVNGIIADFRAGRKDSEHFWIHLGEKYLHISYFAVRDAEGEYLGTLETIQDIAPLQQISGDKRMR